MTPCSESHQTCLVVRSTYRQTPCSRRVPRRRCASDTDSARPRSVSIRWVASLPTLSCCALRTRTESIAISGDRRLETGVSMQPSSSRTSRNQLGRFLQVLRSTPVLCRPPSPLGATIQPSSRQKHWHREERTWRRGPGYPNCSPRRRQKACPRW